MESMEFNCSLGQVSSGNLFADPGIRNLNALSDSSVRALEPVGPVPWGKAEVLR